MTPSLLKRLTYALDDIIGDDDVPVVFHQKYSDLLHEALLEIETEEKEISTHGDRAIQLRVIRKK